MTKTKYAPIADARRIDAGYTLFDTPAEAEAAAAEFAAKIDCYDFVAVHPEDGIGRSFVNITDPDYDGEVVAALNVPEYA